jgi:prepilin-type N-terminal cleavage/methylation domain-containing protein
MLNRTKNQAGFTIVELLIVIVVIGILAALVLNTFQGVQARARDTERRTDINSIATQLEAYFADFGYYPDGSATASCDDGTATAAACTLSNLLPPRGLDAEALNDPSGTAITVGANPAATTTDTGYYYDITGATCATNQCDSFVLSTDLESDGTLYDKPSLN